MNRKVLISLILVIIWMGFIFFMSSMNKDESDTTSTSIAIDIVDGVDKITKASEEVVKKHQEVTFIKHANHVLRKTAHAFCYFILSLLFLNLLMQINKYTYFIRNIINILFCFFYACTDEIHQTFVSGRGGQFSDVLIDTFGALIGCIIFYLVYKIIVKRKKIQKIRDKKITKCRIA